MKQLTQAEAVEMYESGKWQEMKPDERAAIQLAQRFLFMPFGEFHKAVEETLGRPVWTHEFAFKQRLIDELIGKVGAPTMEDIINLIPADKLIVILESGLDD